MYQLKFTLKQHTPIIHFQHNQDGATLRATEVKPKLDRYIIENLSGIIKARELHPDWFVSKDHKALDYKLKLEAIGSNKLENLVNVRVNKDHSGIEKTIYNQPIGFFGNLMKPQEFKNGKQFKKVSFYNELSLIINSKSRDLINKIDNVIADFFFLNNFGTRQNRGFGCCEILDKSPNVSNYYYFSFENMKDDSIMEIFEKIDLFYRCLKSGLNIKTKIKGDGPLVDKMYFKSLMFQFAKTLKKPEQWDKRTIRDFQFQNHRKYKKQSQQIQNGIYEERTDLVGTVHFTSEISDDRFYFDFRDLLGLSSEQDWIFYDKSKLTKKVTYKQIDNNGQPEILEAERFNSPISFKPIYDSKTKIWVIYIILKSIPTNYLASNVEVKVNGENSQNLTMYPSFDLEKYLKFSINKFDVNDIEYGSEFEYENTTEAKIINQIFSQLKKQIKNI